MMAILAQLSVKPYDFRVSRCPIKPPSRRHFLGAASTAFAAIVTPSTLAAPETTIKAQASPARPTLLPRIQVHREGHFLQTADGKPFFWLGDTAWELIHSTTRDECSYYLQTRADQGFNVIQAVVLSEMDGIRRPSALGLNPFHDNSDSSQPNDAYFTRVVEIADEAAARGLYVALLPTWGDKLTAPWGEGPQLFRNDNLPQVRTYATYLAGRLRERTNVIWMLGGDRPARIRGASSGLGDTARQFGISQDEDWTPVWRALAEGLVEGSGRDQMILYHPQGGPESTSVLLRDASWLAVNGVQSGHGGGHDVPVWDMIARDYAIVPPKPTLDLEPNYEDHPYNPWPAWDPASGYFRDYDVRKQLYRSVFAGACGVTYGHHAVWQFANRRNGVVNHADRDWIDALQRPGGRQAVFLRRLIESRPFFDRIPDQTIVASGTGTGGDHAQATRDRAGSCLLIYFPRSDQTATIDLSSLRSTDRRAWWYDPRTGVATPLDRPLGMAQLSITTPPNGPDWILVVEDAMLRFAPPGIVFQISEPLAGH